MKTRIISPVIAVTALLFTQCGLKKTPKFEPNTPVIVEKEEDVNGYSSSPPPPDFDKATTVQDPVSADNDPTNHTVVNWAKSAVIYEVNTRQYTQEGTFNAFAKHLPRLKNLGVDVLWFMPIQPIGVKNRKGELGSYYSISNYTGVNTEYGNIEDFKAIIKTAHQMGMKVILDWVGNHTAWDHPWIQEHPNWYVHNDSGKIVTPWDWTDVAQLDYSNKELRAAMIEQMRYWLDLGLDGFRCDVSFLVPVSFWNEARESLTHFGNVKVISNGTEETRDIFMLAEMEWNTDKEANPAKYMYQAFDAYYAWTFHGKAAELAKGKIDAKTFLEITTEMRQRFPHNSMPMTFITNHDENSWNGTVNEKFGDKWKLFSALCYTYPNGIPMIYSGEEANNPKRLEFFKKDPIKWGDTSRFAWYRFMNNLKETHPALHSSVSSSRVVTSPMKPAEGMSAGMYIYTLTDEYTKKSITVVANLSDEAGPIDLSRLEGFQNLTTKNIATGEKFILDSKSTNLNSIQMNPWGFFILNH